MFQPNILLANFLLDEYPDEYPAGWYLVNIFWILINTTTEYHGRCDTRANCGNWRGDTLLRAIVTSSWQARFTVLLMQSEGLAAPSFSRSFSSLRAPERADFSLGQGIQQNSTAYRQNYVKYSFTSKPKTLKRNIP